MPEKRRVYCAGPMFSPGDKYEQTNIAEMLEKAGFDTFLPQRDGIELKSVMQKLNDPGMLATVMLFLPVLRHAVFALDLYQVLAWSDCIVFNMNGRTPDDGGIVEATAGFLSGKAVVLYKETPISFIAGDDNPMIDGLGYDWVNVGSVREIPAQVTAMLDTTARAAQRNNWTASLPPLVQESITLGLQISEVRRAITKGWSASVDDLLQRIPALVASDAPIRVGDDGAVVIGEDFLLGHLEGTSDSLKVCVQILWAVFCDGVNAITGHARHLLERPLP